MTELTIIRRALHDQGANRKPILLRADRTTLAKRRWRAAAEDGREFGFDLESPLRHGDIFFAEADRKYAMEQLPEEVLEIPVESPEQAARVGWMLGNLHFGVQVLPSALRVIGDSAVLQALHREHLEFRRVTDIFLPLTAATHHHHE